MVGSGLRAWLAAGCARGDPSIRVPRGATAYGLVTVGPSWDCAQLGPFRSFGTAEVPLVAGLSVIAENNPAPLCSVLVVSFAVERMALVGPRGPRGRGRAAFWRASVAAVREASWDGLFSRRRGGAVLSFHTLANFRWSALSRGLLQWSKADAWWCARGLRAACGGTYCSAYADLNSTDRFHMAHNCARMQAVA